MTIGEQHGDAAAQNGNRQQQQESRNQHGPCKQRHFVQSHPWGPHIQNGGDEINRPQNGRCPRQVKRKNGHVHGNTRVTQGSAEGWVNGPTRSCPAVHKSRAQKQKKRGHNQPETDVIQPRKGHIRRPDHQRHKPVSKAPNQRRHDHKKHHNQTMGRDQNVIKLVVPTQNLQPWLLKLHPHHHGKQARNQAGQHRKNQIKSPNILMVCG